MNTAMPIQQRGITFGGFIFGAFLLVIASLFGLKLIPAYMQDAQIKNVFNAIANDPDMQKASPREIRASFEKRSSIDAIKAIKAEDIEISSDNGKPSLSASYSVKLPLAGNISLVLEFNPSSAQ
ncbi:MAG: DUF4845 domain-containing protein [Gallionella sp.]|nr:DUF4845 domain-containing protein [Gallionella sp.]